MHVPKWMLCTPTSMQEKSTKEKSYLVQAIWIRSIWTKILYELTILTLITSPHGMHDKHGRIKLDIITF